MIVAYIAYNHLNKNAKCEVAKLIAIKMTLSQPPKSLGQNRNFSANCMDRAG